MTSLRHSASTLTSRPYAQAQGGTQEARRRQAAGFTLLETMIVLAVFIIVIGAVLENLTATAQMSALVNANAEIDSEANASVTTITNDLGSAGWYLPDLSTQYSATPVSTVLDRSLQYYPYVLQQAVSTTNNAGLPTNANLTMMIRSAVSSTDYGLVAPNTVAVPTYMPNGPAGAGIGYGSVKDFDYTWGTANDAAYYRSFFARSQELVFIRAASGSWIQNSTSQGLSATNCANATLANYAYPASYCTTPQTLPGSYAPPILNFKNAPTYDNLWLTSGNNAALGVLNMSGFVPTYDSSTGLITGYTEILTSPQEAPYGRLLDCAYWDTTNLEELQFETVTPPTYISQSPTAVYDNTKFREYMYAVLPSPISLGMLVRLVKVSLNGNFPNATYDPVSNKGGHITIGDVVSKNAANTYGMVIDKILSQDVVRVVFDTVRTTLDKTYTASDGSTVYALPLCPNQVRMRLYMMHQSVANPRLLAGQIVESVIAMRALSDNGAATATTLGDATLILGLEDSTSSPNGSLSLNPHPIPGLPH
jgi:type II secretory pathway pseudopilin PulG